MIAKQFQTDIPPAVLQVTEGFRKNNDTISEFLEQCCEIGEELSVSSGTLYKTYREFCSQNGKGPSSTTDFYNSLEKMSFERKRTTKGVKVIGLELTEEYVAI